MMISWEIAPSSFDELRLHIERFTHVASIYANLLKQKKSIYMRKEFNSQMIFLVLFLCFQTPIWLP